MEEDQLLDHFSKKEDRRYLNFSFMAFMSTITFMIILTLLYKFYNDGQHIKIIGRSIVFGYVVSSVCGFICTIIGHKKGEKVTTFITIVTVVNIILFIIAAIMVGIIIYEKFYK